VMDSTKAMSEDDKMLLNFLEHVSRSKVYFLIDQLFMMLTFAFAHTLALSKARIAANASDAVEQSRIADLEEASAQLRAELDQARARISEVESFKNVLSCSERKLKRRKLAMLKLLRVTINFRSFANTFARGCVTFARR
jgi:uncharacterized protein YlxW (UPF0749 family)